MKEVLLQYAGDKPIEVIPVWSDNTFLKPVAPSHNPFLKKHNLLGKFVVMYSGNLGLSGDIDVLVDIAAQTKSDNIAFVIIGEGSKKELIKEKTEKMGIKNLVLLPWQPATELPFSLSAAGLAVISLGKSASKLAVPSKLYNFLSVGAPLLCMASKESEVNRMVSKYECGRCFEPDDFSGMLGFITELSRNEELFRQMRNNSLAASENFTSTNSMRFLQITNSDSDN
jgi:glycosyltransferase involved in cell wall biosynthesis